MNGRGKLSNVGDAVHLATVPPGSSIEQLDDGSVMAFLPDGSAQRVYPKIVNGKVVGVVDSFPAITIKADKL